MACSKGRPRGCAGSSSLTLGRSGMPASNLAHSCCCGQRTGRHGRPGKLAESEGSACAPSSTHVGRPDRCLERGCVRRGQPGQSTRGGRGLPGSIRKLTVMVPAVGSTFSAMPPACTPTCQVGRLVCGCGEWWVNGGGWGWGGVGVGDAVRGGVGGWGLGVGVGG